MEKQTINSRPDLQDFHSYMDIRESIDNSSDQFEKIINAAEFANFASNHINLWSKIQGAKIQHSEYGLGEIIRIEQGSNYMPLILICVLFENNGEKIIYTEDFKFGIVETIKISKEQNEALQRISFADFEVESLWHMTHFKNLSSICKYGILSYYEVHKRRFSYFNISNHEVQQCRDKKPPNSSHSIHEYVPLYIKPRNPMLYKIRSRQDHICLIEIDLKVLDNNEFLLTDGNAAASATQFFNKLSDLKFLPWDVLESDSWYDKEDGKRKRCAEVLILNKIDPQYIKALHFRKSIPTLDGVEKQRCITPSLYF